MSQHDSVAAGGLCHAPRLAHGIAVLGVILLGACSDSTDSLVAPAQRPLPRPLAALGAANDTIPGKYIVTFRSDVGDVRGLAKQLVEQLHGRLGFTYTSAIKGFSAQLPEQAIAALQRNPQIERIEPDLIVRASGSGVQTNPIWNLDRIDQRNRPIDKSYSYATDGSGVNVYILDTGIRTTHVEFGGRAFGAFTAINDGRGTNDCGGHGTLVSGTVGGTQYGVAKAVKLYAVRVLDCSSVGANSGIIAGIDWVTSNRVLPAVANMSMAGAMSSTMNAAVQNSIKSGVVYTIAAGNNAANACNYSPGSTAEALTVGAVSNADVMSSFSNSGSCVDLFAPGESVRTAFSIDDTSSMVAGGTSMAAPHVAGVAALYLSANPTATPAQVVSAIVGNATQNVVSGLASGTPNLLIYSSVTAPPAPADTATATPSPTDTTTTPPPPPPDTTTISSSPTDQPPVASFTSSCPHGKCTFDGSGSKDDVAIASYNWNVGDGSTTSSGTSAAKVTHTYTKAGSFTVILTVTDTAGQRSSKSVTLVFRKL